MAELTRRFNVRIPLRDGITLSADLTLPDVRPAPALVIRTPYGKTGERQSRRGTTFATAGYATVTVDVRGRGDSDGRFQPYRHDGPDGYDVIGWVAAQDWCTGDVASHGASYSGRIQWLTALEHPPALRAMVCMVTPSDPFVEAPTGVPTPMHINWFRLVDARVVQYAEDVNWNQVYKHRPLMTMDFGPNALIDLDAAVVAFLDEHVKGIKPGQPAAPVRFFVMGAGEWRDEPSWPPPYVTETTLYLSSGGSANSLHGDGRLSAAAPDGGQPPDSWVHDPDRPVPFITGPSSAQIGGPDDYHGVETRGDVLVYSSDPLTEPAEVIGPVRLVAHVATSAADTDVTAKLVDVHPNGFAQRLCDGMLRLRYRNGFGREELVTPGQVHEVSIAMWDTCLRLEPGHRLRLEVASSAFPKIDVNLGTGGDMVTETDGVIAHNELWHTAARPSRLVLCTRSAAA